MRPYSYSILLEHLTSFTVNFYMKMHYFGLNLNLGKVKLTYQ